jgi:gliding motility-associated protein GldM
LKKILEAYKNSTLNIDPKIKAEFEKSFQVDTEMPKDMVSKKKSWEEAYFYMSPTIGALSILSKFQNDIRTSENKMVTFCHEQVGKVEIVFDSYAAIVGQSSNYVMPGQTLTVNAGVGAYSKTAKPSISIGGSGVEIGEEGFAKREITAGGPGEYSIPVKISYFNQTTNKQEEKIETIKYTVGSPGGASVALDKMNVLYIGVDNPITVASSVGLNKTSVNISGGGGSLSGGGGKYIARVNSVTDDCTITVTADGKPSVFKFRVRTVPLPVATVGGVASNENVPAGQFKAQTGVGAYIKDFPFDLKYTVVSFTITADNADGDIDEAACTGNTWSPKAQSMVKGLTAGRMVTIDNIRAQGPDGRVSKIPGLVYYIK